MKHKSGAKKRQKRGEGVDRLAEKPFAEIFAPFRRNVEESGMTEDELDNFFNEIREKVWQEKRAKGQA
jgi:hypothetical protein